MKNRLHFAHAKSKQSDKLVKVSLFVYCRFAGASYPGSGEQWDATACTGSHSGGSAGGCRHGAGKADGAGAVVTYCVRRGFEWSGASTVSAMVAVPSTNS